MSSTTRRRSLGVVISIVLWLGITLDAFNAFSKGQEVASRQSHRDAMPLLEVVSDLSLNGHPISYDVIPRYISRPDKWNITTVVDYQALAKNGIHFNEICPYYELSASGVSRRSSLRFVLDSCGLGYYTDGETLVVTTKHCARVKWLGQLTEPTLVMLASPAVDQRRTAAFAAGYWHLDSSVWVEPLVRALTDSDRQVCFDAAYALGEFGPLAAKAVDSLVKLVMAEDVTLREGAVFALGKIGPDAIERLLELVDNRDATIGIAAAKSLDVMGSVGKRSVPGLIAIAMRRANERELCDQISQSIARIDSLGVIAALRELLRNGSPLIRAFAANTIAEIGVPAEECAPDLLLLLSDQSSTVRIHAAHALAQLDLPGSFSTLELERALNDPDSEVSSWAAEAIRKINSKK